jgi:hypothetical protein
VDERKPLPDLLLGIFAKLLGDRGYICLDLFEQLEEQQLQLITRSQKKMKQKLVQLIEQILGRKRAITSRLSTTNSKISFKSNIQSSVVWGIF